MSPSLTALAAIVSSVALASADPCPAGAASSIDAADLELYRNAPNVTSQGNYDKLSYMGFKPEYAECESCASYTRFSSTPEGTEYIHLQNYNSEWNKEIGSREFWESAERGNGKSVSAIQQCPYGYEKSSLFSMSATCQIPVDSRFLGESCDHLSQCNNAFVSGMLDVTCAPTAKDSSAPEYKCMLTEDYDKKNKGPE